MPARIYITQLIPEPGPSLLAEVTDQIEQNQEDRVLSTDELIEKVDGFDGILCLLTDQIDARVIQAAKRCRIIANMAVGFNNIDVDEATRHGIAVTNTPGILTDSTADLTWALILGISRRVVEGDHEMREGRFQGWGPLYMLGGDVTEATLGLIGPGRIATAVARRAAGFRMKILYYGRRRNEELDQLGGTLVTLSELLASSDFVSIHVPLTPETHHLIDAEALERMKPTAYLINTSRGPVVDEAALVKVLRESRIAGAGLDVYEAEPAMAEGLSSCSNAVLLPHLGSATRATRGAMSRLAAQNLVAGLCGQRPPHLVNPSVWSQHA